jgi:hypothetical protein
MTAEAFFKEIRSKEPIAQPRSSAQKMAGNGGGFLRFPIGDRRCNRTRASVGNAAGTRAQALQSIRTVKTAARP